MSDSAQIDPTVALYAYRLGHAATDLAILADQAANMPEFRNQLRYLNFYARRIRSTLPRDGTEIGPRWWSRYSQFFAMVENLGHPGFDDDIDSLWVGLPEPN